MSSIKGYLILGGGGLPVMDRFGYATLIPDLDEAINQAQDGQSILPVRVPKTNTTPRRGRRPKNQEE
jgi:hypothetical protein